MVVGLETGIGGNDLKDVKSLCFVILSFSLFSSIQVWMSESLWDTGILGRYWTLHVLWKGGVLNLSVICKRLRLSGMAPNRVRQGFSLKRMKRTGPRTELCGTWKVESLAMHGRWWLFCLPDKRRIQYQRCYTGVGDDWEMCSGQWCQMWSRDPRVLLLVLQC